MILGKKKNSNKGKKIKATPQRQTIEALIGKLKRIQTTNKRSLTVLYCWDDNCNFQYFTRHGLLLQGINSVVDSLKK